MISLKDIMLLAGPLAVFLIAWGAQQRDVKEILRKLGTIESKQSEHGVTLHKQELSLTELKGEIGTMKAVDAAVGAVKGGSHAPPLVSAPKK